MPKYKFTKKDSEDMDMSMGKMMPGVYLQASMEQAKAVQVGEEVEVLVKGKVTGISMHEDYANINIEMMETDVYGKGEENAVRDLMSDD